MRPEFTVPIKESLKKLIIQCWSDDPNERPTFDEIFKKLAFNLEDSVYDVFEDDEDYKFYLDGVDVDEVLNYAYEISEKQSDVIDQIKAENKKLKEDNAKLMKENKMILNEFKRHDELIQGLINDNKTLKEENKIILDQ